MFSAQPDSRNPPSSSAEALNPAPTVKAPYLDVPALILPPSPFESLDNVELWCEACVVVDEGSVVQPDRIDDCSSPSYGRRNSPTRRPRSPSAHVHVTPALCVAAVDDVHDFVVCMK